MDNYKLQCSRTLWNQINYYSNLLQFVTLLRSNFSVVFVDLVFIGLKLVFSKLLPHNCCLYLLYVCQAKTAKCHFG